MTSELLIWRSTELMVESETEERISPLNATHLLTYLTAARLIAKFKALEISMFRLRSQKNK